MSNTMSTNGGAKHKAAASPINRIAEKSAGVAAPDSNESGAVHQDPANSSNPVPKTEGKTAKILLGLGAALVAIVATEYALRKFTKTGGIIPHLLRLEKLSNAYLATVEKP